MATVKAPQIDDMSVFARTIAQKRYMHPGETSWRDVAKRVSREVLSAINAPRDTVREVEEIIATRRFMPGGRYLAAAGLPFHQTQNCLLLKAEDTREGWADLASKSIMALMTGAGIGVDYSQLRPKGSPIKRTGGFSSGPVALMQGINDLGHAAIQGGHRRAAIWAGLNWAHPDVMEFIRLKDWPEELRKLKEKDFNSAAPMDFTNISTGLDDDFFSAFSSVGHPKHEWAVRVYWETLEHALETGDPGFAIDVGKNAGETARNACTEVTSRDDSDICNLGSINLARIDTIDEMRKVVELGSLFLLAGTVYSDVPYQKVSKVREKNRRLGLGLMGIHEWLLTHGKKYGPDDDLGLYLLAYEESGSFAAKYAHQHSLSVPIATRAIAPTGTIGIVAETTTGMEPIICAAYKRRYFESGVWRYQYVLDPTAKNLVQQGVNPDQLEDAYSLSNDVERRLQFQAWLQRHVDQAISSTINMPKWGSPNNNPDTVRPFGKMLMNYLPEVRGITIYPDGARGGQPITAVPWREAANQQGEVFTEAIDVCDLRGGGSCGS